MAVDVAAGRLEGATVRERFATIPVGATLTALVGTSFVLRLLLAWQRPTPTYFPDEYLYRTLADSIATTGRPLVRGSSAHFPALLEPLLIAPFSALGNEALAFRLTQGLHSFAMSLAAIPVYLLARRLDFRPGLALCAGALAVSAPGLRYSAFVLADPIAYPLVLAATYVGVLVLERPTRRNQLAFAALTSLATFARIQYLALPVVLIVASVVVERGHVLTVARRLRLSLALFGTAAFVAVALGWERTLGSYSGFVQTRPAIGAVLSWLGRDALLAVYPSGWVIAPAAVAGLALGLAKPRSRAEAAFAALTSVLALALLSEAAAVAANTAERFQERYLICLIPLLAPAFLLAMNRPRARVPSTVLAVGLLLWSARVPLTSYAAAHGHDDSPTLTAVLTLQRLAGVGTGSLAIALTAGLLSLSAIAIAWRPRLGTAAGLALALLATGAISVGVASYDARTSHTGARSLPADLEWVDRMGLDRVALLQPPDSDPWRGIAQLFWNRSVTDVFILGNGVPSDTYGARRLTVGTHGELDANGRTVRQPLLVQTFGSFLDLRGATLLAAARGFELWQPGPKPRLALLATGRSSDGWLAGGGYITVWPRSDGRRRTLSLTLYLPRSLLPTALRFTGSASRRVWIHPGERRTVSFRIPAQRRWSVRYEASRARFSDGRPVSVRAGKPKLVPARA